MKRAEKNRKCLGLNELQRMRILLISEEECFVNARQEITNVVSPEARPMRPKCRELNRSYRTNGAGRENRYFNYRPHDLCNFMVQFQHPPTEHSYPLVLQSRTTFITLADKAAATV